MAVAQAVPERLTLDVSTFPLVSIRFPRDLDERALSALRAAQERIYGHDARYVSLVDMRGTSIMPRPTIRREASEWTKAQEPRLRKYQVANVLVVDSALVRAGIQAVHWFAAPPVPTLVTGSFQEGARYLRSRAADDGLVLGLLANNRLDSLENG